MDKPNKAWRGCLYLRLSKEDGDKEESFSITNQRALLLAHAQILDDITITTEKVDDGWSGANFQRPGFVEMMEEIRQGKVNCVIVKDLTRFGRNFGESGKYIEHVFPFLGVRFISVNDGIDSANKQGRGDDILVPFLNLISDAYARDISIKIRSQLEDKRRRGEFVGAFAPYGYQRDKNSPGKLAIDKTAAPVVKMIYDCKLDGQSAEHIAGRLNVLGIPSPMAHKKSCGHNFSTPFAPSDKTDSTKWFAPTVLRILKDERYTGVMVQGKVATPNHKVKKKLVKPAQDWARVERTHEGIVSPWDFKLVQKQLERDTRTPARGPSVLPFSGMARCGLCGENMVRKTSHAGGRAYVYLVCCRRCKRSRVRENALANCVEAALQTELTRRIIVSLVDTIIIYPGNRLVLLLNRRL